MAALSTAALAAALLTACSSDAPTMSTPTAAGTQASSPSVTTPETPGTPSGTSSAAPSITAPGASSGSLSSSSARTSTTPTSQAPTGKPPTGKNAVVARSKKFQITAPAGWRDLSGTFKATKMIELAVAAPKPEQGTLTNLNVIGIAGGPAGADIKAAEAAGAKAWRAKGSTVKELPARAVAGEKAYGYTMRANGQDAAISQYYLAHSGTIYILTMTSHQDAAAAAAQSLDQIVGTWAWRR